MHALYHTYKLPYRYTHCTALISYLIDTHTVPHVLVSYRCTHCITLISYLKDTHIVPHLLVTL